MEELRLRTNPNPKMNLEYDKNKSSQQAGLIQCVRVNLKQWYMWHHWLSACPQENSCVPRHK